MVVPTPELAKENGQIPVGSCRRQVFSQGDLLLLETFVAFAFSCQLRFEHPHVRCHTVEVMLALQRFQRRML